MTVRSGKYDESHSISRSEILYQKTDLENSRKIRVFVSGNEFVRDISAVS